MITQHSKASPLLAQGPSGVMRRVLMFLIRVYQTLLSPLFGKTCMYYPSCSNYALGAIERHGCFRGGLLTIRRILRCNPLASGGLDPVPESTNHRECKNH
jgi:uncharacterized protein